MSYLTHLLNSPVEVVIVWGLVALLVILLFLRKPRTVVLASSKTGRLEISRHALNRLLEACCEQLKGVVSARARVTGRAGKFKTHIRLKVRPDAKLDAIQGYLSQEIVDIYRQNLGIANTGPVEIHVVGVIPESKDF